MLSVTDAVTFVTLSVTAGILSAAQLYGMMTVSGTERKRNPLLLRIIAVILVIIPFAVPLLTACVLKIRQNSPRKH